MPVTLVHPGNERMAQAAAPPARLTSLAGKKLGLLDISKPGGSLFLDRLEEILRTRYGAAEIIRARKPTFARCHLRVHGAGAHPGQRAGTRRV